MSDFREQVHKLAAEWDTYLPRPGPTYWKIDGIKDPKAFFKHLPKIFPHGLTLFIEEIEASLTAKSLYADYPARYRRKVPCDVICPPPESYHVVFTADFADQLCQLLTSQGFEGTLYHLKGYSEQEIVFSFHEAFTGELVVSNSKPETVVREFAASLNCSVELARYPVDAHEQLVLMDRALNPPWWKRLLQRFKRDNCARP
jgi:hypothetical protein